MSESLMPRVASRRWTESVLCQFPLHQSL